MTAIRYIVNPEIRICPSKAGGFALWVPDDPESDHGVFQASSFILEVLEAFTRESSCSSVVRRIAKRGGVTPEAVRDVIKNLIDAGAIRALSQPSGGEGLSARQKAVLLEGAKRGVLPANVACPVGCKFCYSRPMTLMYPGCVIDFIPRYDKSAFEFFFKLTKQLYGGPITIDQVWLPRDEHHHYAVQADVFALGLTEDQLGSILSHNQKLSAQERWRNFQTFWYTTGYGLNPSVVQRLSNRYQGTFRLVVSAITFSEVLRKSLIPHGPSADEVKRVILSTPEPCVYVLHVSVRQTLQDLAVIDQLRLANASVVVAPLQCTQWHSEDVKSLARNADRGLTRVATWILANKRRFSSLKPENISFHGPARALALKHQEEIRSLFCPYEINQTDLVLCSVAAEPMIRRILNGRCQVVAVADALRGTTSFAATVTTADLSAKLQQLIRRGRRFKRVFLPSSFWCYRNQDLNGVAPQALQTEFSNMEIVVLPVPIEVLQSELTCVECAQYSPKTCRSVESGQTTSESAASRRPVFLPLQPLGWVNRARGVLRPLQLGCSDLIVCAASRVQHVRELVGTDVRVISVDRLIADTSGSSNELELENIHNTEPTPVNPLELRRLLVLTDQSFERDALPRESIARIRDAFATTKIVVVIVPAF